MSSSETTPLLGNRNIDSEMVMFARRSTTAGGFMAKLNKLAVESEPGLSSSQLMLTNKDLKPGMTFPKVSRRQLETNKWQLNRIEDNGDRGTSSGSGSRIHLISTHG